MRVDTLSQSALDSVAQVSLGKIEHRFIFLTATFATAFPRYLERRFLAVWLRDLLH